MTDRFAPHAPEPAHFIPFEAEDARQTLTARFEQQVRLYPDRLAYDDDLSRAVTYQQLNTEANRVAHAILGREHDAQAPVAGVMFNFSAESIVSALAILKAGWTIMALDPTYPEERNRFLMHDSGASLLLTSASHRALSAAYVDEADDVLTIEEIVGASNSDHNPDLDVSVDTKAHLFYTSGSTGTPKGVAQPHRNLMHFVRYATNGVRFCSRDRVVLVSSLSYGNFLGPGYGALLNGGAILPYDLRARPLEDMPRWLCEQKATYLAIVPSVFRRLVHLLSEGDHFPDLRIMRLGGESFRAGDIEAYRRWFPESTLGLSYGATETTLLTLGFAGASAEIDPQAIPCGFPFGEHELLILDDEGNPVEAGQLGEIVIRSSLISGGYWQRPELSAERFAVDADDPTVSIYATGDLAEQHPDGWIIHRGRKDSQVKVRGLRIEVGEIESVLVRQPDISEAVVIAYQSVQDDTHLAAYILPVEGRTIVLEALRDALARSLPDYMIPTRLIMVDDLPQTTSGKIDRTRLPAPEQTRPDLMTPYVAPRTELEVMLAGVWSTVLGIDRVGVNDAFLDLGGHSLLATELISRVSKMLGLTVSIEALFDAPTIARMAEMIESLDDPDTAEGVKVIKPVPRDAYQTPSSDFDEM